MAKIITTYRFNYSFLFWFIFSTLTFILFPGYNSFASTHVILEWTSNSEPDLAGYRVFLREDGQSYDYTNPSWEGTEATAIVYNIDDTKTYYFVARAFDSEGFESGDSNEVCLAQIFGSGGEKTIEAEDMPIKTTGGSTTDGWNIWSNGYIADDVNFQTEGTYTFDVTAKGSFAGGAWPIMEVRIDQTNVGTVTVDSSNWTVYTIEAYVTSGTHEVAIAFTNDYYNSPEDRNLLIDKIIVTESGNNEPPIANAGPDQTTDAGQLVTLNGSNSTDPDDGIASYHWVQTGGSPVTLSDPNGQQATFTAPDVETTGASLTFELTVVDHSGLENTDSCVVNVTLLNEPPQADAGTDKTVNEGGVVTLDGSSSLDIDDGIAVYSWTQISGPTVTLSNPTSSQPTFTAPNVGSDGASLTFNLTVTDAGGMQNTDSCIVNISWQNQPPTAVVIPDYMETTEGSLVRLDGSASKDSDDGIASYLWTQVDGDPVSLSDPTSAVTTITAPKTDSLDKNLKFKLTVKDHGGLQSSADSFIYIRQKELSNNPPASDFSYATMWRKTVRFTDRSTDSDGTIVSWFWNFGDGKTRTRKNPWHRYRKIGNYSVTLTVTDDGGVSKSTSKTVFVAK